LVMVVATLEAGVDWKHLTWTLSSLGLL
jgi:hypothetical protein